MWCGSYVYCFNDVHTNTKIKRHQRCVCVALTSFIVPCYFISFMTRNRYMCLYWRTLCMYWKCVCSFVCMYEFHSKCIVCTLTNTPYQAHVNKMHTNWIFVYGGWTYVRTYIRLHVCHQICSFYSSLVLVLMLCLLECIFSL